MLRVISALLFFGVVLPSVCYIIFFSREYYTNDLSKTKQFSCSHSERHYIKCGHEVNYTNPNIYNQLIYYFKVKILSFQNITESSCVQLACCFSPLSGCFHSMPSRYQYVLTSINEPVPNVARGSINPLSSATPFQTSSLPLSIVLTKYDDRRLNINVGTGIRETEFSSANHSVSTLYDYTFDSRFFALEIRTKSTNKLLLTTNRGSFIASDHYFEWTFYLGTSVLYGLGEYLIDEKPIKKVFLRNGNVENSFLPIVIARMIGMILKSIYVF